MDALRVVANVDALEERDRLREELAEAKKALEALRSQAHAHSEKYFSLAWWARHGWAAFDDSSHPGHGKAREIHEQYRDEVMKLSSDSGLWDHGFNSGLLAAARLYEGLSGYTKEHVPPDSYYAQDGHYDSDADTYVDGEVPSLAGKLEREREFALDNFPNLDT